MLSGVGLLRKMMKVLNITCLLSRSCTLLESNKELVIMSFTSVSAARMSGTVILRKQR